MTEPCAFFSSRFRADCFFNRRARTVNIWLLSVQKNGKKVTQHSWNEPLGGWSSCIPLHSDCSYFLVFLLSSCYPWPQIWESKDCCPSVVLLLNAPIIHTTRRAPPPPNTLISHCAYQWSRYTLLHCQLRQWKAKVVLLSKGIEKTKLVPTLSVMTPREFIELLQQGAVSTQREAASLLSSSALQFML